MVGDAGACLHPQFFCRFPAHRTVWEYENNFYLLLLGIILVILIIAGLIILSRILKEKHEEKNYTIVLIKKSFTIKGKNI